MLVAPLLTFRTSSGTAVEATANSADRRNCRYVRSDVAWIWRNGYYKNIYVSIVARPMAFDHNKLKNDQEKQEWVAPQILEMSTALTEGKSYGGIEASPLEPPGPS